jgi:replicative DNA helicase
MEQEQISDESLEKLIIKGILNDKQFLTMVLKPFEPDYFDNPVYEKIFTFTTNHFKQYKKLPDTFILKDIVEDFEVIENINDIPFSLDENKEYLLKETNRYMKEKAVKKAILEGVDVIDSKGDYNKIKEKITSALSKDLIIDLGLDYWNTLGKRLRSILELQEKRVPLGFPMLDEFINGGVLPYTLSLFLSRVHGFKSTLLINILERMSRNGKNVIIFSMEMSENEIAKRIDSISTKSHINKMYSTKNNIKELGKKLVDKKKEYKGKIIVKEFPTGNASTADFRSILREYQYRGIEFDACLCDYLTIMKPEGKTNGELYQSGKKISEELRALSKEFVCLPMIGVMQLNRFGMSVDFNEVDLTHIGESLGISMSADFMAIMGKDEEQMTYESELLYKIVKNRLGGRVNEIGKFYVDKNSLKLYDSSELDSWYEDAKLTNDERKTIQKY